MPPLSDIRDSIRVVALGDRRVGPGERVMIVAEAGINHNGSLATALEMVDAAADAGADAVKFQVFAAEQLATANATTAGYQKDNTGAATQRELLTNLELTDQEFAIIRERCADRRIIFLATPFSVGDVARLTALNVVAIKLASTDLTNVILQDEVAKTGLPLILSTGASSKQEIESCIQRLFEAGLGDRLILLHCVSRYPVPLASLNLGAIANLQRRSGLPCGFSDHSESVLTGGWAVAAGACMLEKHFTLDRSGKGPDHRMSLNVNQLRDYVQTARTVQQAMGRGKLGMDPLEQEVRNIASKSVVAAQGIEAGTLITREMLTVKRPGTGIAPTELGQLVGRCASQRIPLDTVLSWSMVG